jgi:hypothetical protein
LKVVKSPDHICLYRTEYANETMEFLTKIDSFHYERKEFCIDFSNCLSISAAAAVVTFAKITRCQLMADSTYDNVSHQSIKIILPLEKVAKRLFVSSGFFDAIRPGGIKKIERLWEDVNNPFKTSNCTDNEIASVIKQLRSRLGSVPDRLVSALSEGYLNIRHHAYAPGTSSDIDGRWWQYVAFNNLKNTLSVVLYDMGVGISETIGRKYVQEGGSALHQDNRIIEYAMIRGKTRYANDQGRGNGFTNIKKPVDINQKAKHLLVCSGKGIVKYSNQEIISSDTLANNSFGGTLIEWCFERGGA